MAPKTPTKAVGTPNATFDPSTFNVTDRVAPKRDRGSGVDRTPYHDFIRQLEVGQVVEFPTPLDRPSAMSLENILRESAKDLGLSISFMTDTIRNREEGIGIKATVVTKDGKETVEYAGTTYIAWLVKGAYKPRQKAS